MDRGKIFFCIFGFPVSQNVKKRVYRKKSRFLDKLIIKNVQNEILYKNWRHLCMVAYSFTKFTQNMCLINTHILIYQYVRCDCKLWNATWFYFVLSLCLNYWIFTKLSQIMYLINVHILVYQHAICDMFDCHISYTGRTSINTGQVQRLFLWFP